MTEHFARGADGHPRTRTHGRLAALFVALTLGAVVVLQTLALPGWLWVAVAGFAPASGLLAVRHWQRYRAACRAIS